jgi:hypothetical protein
MNSLMPALWDYESRTTPPSPAHARISLYRLALTACDELSSMRFPAPHTLYKYIWEDWEEMRYVGI